MPIPRMEYTFDHVNSPETASLISSFMDTDESAFTTSTKEVILFAMLFPVSGYVRVMAMANCEFYDD
jgi:hypothetical protein